MRWHLLFPLISSLIYVSGAMWLKRASELGVGVWPATCFSNLITTLFFVPLILMGGNPQPISALWQPGLVSLLLVLGQYFAILALNRGDVSVATPVMSIKTVLVAVLSTIMLHQMPSFFLWAGATISSFAVLLLHHKGQKATHQVRLTVVSALLAASFFALFDVLVQKWSSLWGPGYFLPLIHILAVVYTFTYTLVLRSSLFVIPKDAWLPMLGGSGLIALQSLLLITTLGIFGDATAVNVIYAARGLWSVLLVWYLGHWFQSKEQNLGDQVLGWRLTGAGLMTVSIILALI